jgi:hypothetical protein
MPLVPTQAWFSSLARAVMNAPCDRLEIAAFAQPTPQQATRPSYANTQSATVEQVRSKVVAEIDGGPELPELQAATIARMPTQARTFSETDAHFTREG